MQEIPVCSQGREEPLEKGMVTHSSILAWRIPWTEDPGRLQSVYGVPEIRTWLSDWACMHIRVIDTGIMDTFMVRKAIGRR